MQASTLISLRQKRIALRLWFLLPVWLLGLALLITGIRRCVAGDSLPADTLSGPGTLALALIPLAAATLLSWLFCRRAQRLPPPAQSLVATPHAQGVRAPSSTKTMDAARIAAAATHLGLTVAKPRAGAISLSSSDRWQLGYLLVFVTILGASWLLPASIDANGLAISPIKPGLAVLGTWLSLPALLLAVPISPRTATMDPGSALISIQVGRRRRRFAQSRLLALEARLIAESSRDSEIQSSQGTRHHAVLIAWFAVENRGPVPFLLISGPRRNSYDSASADLSHAAGIADAIAAAFGASTDAPEGADESTPPYE